MIKLNTPYWMSGQHISIFYAKNKDQLIGVEFFRRNEDEDFLYGCSDFWSENDIKGDEAPNLIKKENEIIGKKGLIDTLFFVGDRYLK